MQQLCPSLPQAGKQVLPAGCSGGILPPREPDRLSHVARKCHAACLELTLLTGRLPRAQAELVGSCRLDVLISCLVMLLERTDLVASALVHHKVVELLLMMMAPQLDGRRRTGGSGVSAAREVMDALWSHCFEGAVLPGLRPNVRRCQGVC